MKCIFRQGRTNWPRDCLSTTRMRNGSSQKETAFGSLKRACKIYNRAVYWVLSRRPEKALEGLCDPCSCRNKTSVRRLGPHLPCHATTNEPRKPTDTISPQTGRSRSCPSCICQTTRACVACAFVKSPEPLYHCQDTRASSHAIFTTHSQPTTPHSRSCTRKVRIVVRLLSYSAVWRKSSRTLTGVAGRLLTFHRHVKTACPTIPSCKYSNKTWERNARYAPGRSQVCSVYSRLLVLQKANDGV
jgi:hypothetical protein